MLMKYNVNSDVSNKIQDTHLMVFIHTDDVSSRVL